MLASLKEKKPAQKAILTDNTTDPKSQPCYNLVKQSPEDFQEKVQEFFDSYPEKLADLESSISEDKVRKKYKARRWSGHSYGVNLITHSAYLFQSYHFSYGVEGKLIRPSKKTLAKELGICIRTLDKALKILKEMEVISWKSGKQT
ncbi:MAG: hypothetical protein KDK71_04145, partial [Chlamydiia bacterium]|nr:hypothetical protein [Chlamydiia bacterium]